MRIIMLLEKKRLKKISASKMLAPKRVSNVFGKVLLELLIYDSQLEYKPHTLCLPSTF